MVDSGGFAPEESEYFPRARAHNILLVDGREPRWQSAEGSVRVDWEFPHGYARLRMTDPGFGFLGLQHERAWFRVDNNAWLILDWLDGRRVHRLTSLIHFYPTFEIVAGGDRARARSRTRSLAVIPVASAKPLASVSHGDHPQFPGWFSPEFGVKIPMTVLALNWTGVELPWVGGALITSGADEPFRQVEAIPAAGRVRLEFSGKAWVLQMKSGLGRVTPSSPAQQKGKPASPSAAAVNFGPVRLRRQRASVDDGFRILLQKQVGDFLTFLFCHLAVAAGKKRRAPPYVVGIAGKEVDLAGIEQLLSELTRFGAEPTRVRLCHDLHQASDRNPVLQQLRFALKEGVPFRVRNDRLKTGDLDVVIHAAEMLRNELVREFHQQVRSSIDREVLGILHADLDVVVREMKVAAQQKLRTLANFFLELGTQLPVEVRVECVAVIAVGRRHQMRHAIRCCDATHRDGHRKRPCTIVNARQRMGVNINHMRAQEVWTQSPSRSASPRHGNFRAQRQSAP